MSGIAPLSKIRVGNVNYLNSTPFASLRRLDFVDYQECVPSECARKLREGETDFACVPLIEYATNGDYQAMDVGIVAKGAVESVFLFAEDKIEDLETIYIDAGSRTSVVLLRVILCELLGKEAGWRVKFYRRDLLGRVADVGSRVGALAIGDVAMKSKDIFSYQLDLGAQWQSFTGMPFVFAVWMWKEGSLERDRLVVLRNGLLDGVRDRAIYARDWADDNQFSRVDAERYVCERITYVLDDRAIEGANEFLRLAALYGLAPRAEFRCAEELSIAKMGRATSASDSCRSLDVVLQDASEGARLSILEGLRLGMDASLADLALASNLRREQLHPSGEVSYIVERNVNYTNICDVNCRFCAFNVVPGKAGGYLWSNEEIGEKIDELVSADGVQVLFQGGLNPELGIEYYENVFRWIKARYQINLHALSADEILHISRVSRISVQAALERLVGAGLGSLPGAGAEILVDRIRRRIAKRKCSAEEWLEVHRTAHRIGLKSSSTMMFGVGETWYDRLIHLSKIRALQDETDGFMAFIAWPFQESSSRLKASDVSAPQYLRVQAVSRLFLDNIRNIQNSWVTQGPAVGQLALFFGANDFGSVMFEENVVSAAGVRFRMDAEAIERHICDAGFLPWQRIVNYQRRVL